MASKDWLKENADGSVDVTLRKPLEMAGAKVGFLRMREPTVDDQIAASAIKGSDAEKEIALISNLCSVAPSDLRTMTLRDYRRVQEAFVGFTE